MVKYCFPRVMWINDVVCAGTLQAEITIVMEYMGGRKDGSSCNYAAEITRYGFIITNFSRRQLMITRGGKDLFLSNSFLTISFSEM